MGILPEIKEVTLLSVEEALNFLSVEEREYKGQWWQRSPGAHHDLAASVYDNGVVNSFGNNVDYNHNYLRPVLNINTQNSDFAVGDIFVFGKKIFQIISDNLAFCADDIGKFCFKRNFETEDANDYEKSDAKKIIDQWYKRATNYHKMMERQIQESHCDQGDKPC